MGTLDLGFALLLVILGSAELFWESEKERFGGICLPSPHPPYALASSLGCMQLISWFALLLVLFATEIANTGTLFLGTLGAEGAQILVRYALILVR